VFPPKTFTRFQQLLPKCRRPIGLAPAREDEAITVRLVQPLFDEHSNRKVVKLVGMIAVCCIHPIPSPHVITHDAHVFHDGEDLELQVDDEIEDLAADFGMVVFGVEGARLREGRNGPVERVAMKVCRRSPSVVLG
jgi:hypothetical protein